MFTLGTVTGAGYLLDAVTSHEEFQPTVSGDLEVFIDAAATDP
jgi:hypothetical protein